MVQFSFFEKLEALMNIIISSTFFMVSLFIGFILLIVMIIGIKKNKKINKEISFAAWLFVIFFILVRYNKIIFGLADNLIENIFMAIYFPNFAIYVVILVTSNLFLIYSLLNKSHTKTYKVFNLLSTTAIDFLFIMIIEIVVNQNIDVYSKLTVYSNQNLLVLLEMSSGIYTVWLISQGIRKFVQKLGIKEDVEQNIIDDDIEVLEINDYDEKTEILFLNE